MPRSETIVEVRRGERLLRQVQGLARDQGRETDHDEERAARDPGNLPRLRDQDLQDRRFDLAAVRVLRQLQCGGAS